MYKPTNQQQTLFGVDTQLSCNLRKRLQSSWAHFFKIEILPILFRQEDQYAFLYGQTGRPNFSVARMLGLCLLQEANNMSDQEALDEFSFDIRWRYALDINEEDGYLSRRSLVEFRRRLAARDPEMKLMRNVFGSIRDSALKKLELFTRDQRLDSTHIISNIRIRGRMSLFSDTLDVFLKRLNAEQMSLVPEGIIKWHTTEAEGWFGLGPTDQKVKLEELARYVYTLIAIFEQDEIVKATEPYQLLVRLFSDQCDYAKEPKTDSDTDTNTRITVKKRTEGITLQSPYDPDASYGHKGAGYSLHVAETCNNPDQSEIITDYEVHGAGRSDIAKALPVIERLTEAGIKPETLFADGGYPSVPSALKITEQQIEFMAPVNRARLAGDVVGRDQFQYDSNGRATKCPMGHSPIDHRILSSNNKTNRTLHAIFDGNICRSCSMLDQCPVRAPNHRERGSQVRETVGDFRLEVTAELRLRDQMYADQQTSQWKGRYKIRSGIEATFSELKRSYGIGKLRVRKMAKVLFAVSCKLIACNVKRWAKAHLAFFKVFLERFMCTLEKFLGNGRTSSVENQFWVRTCIL